MLFEKNDEESEDQYSKYRNEDEVNNNTSNSRYNMIKAVISEVVLLSIVFGVLAYMLSYTNASCPYG